jgi:hypothetical protein
MLARIFLSALIGALEADAVFAQAWIAPGGEGTISLGYQFNDFTGHYTSEGAHLDLGGSRSQVIFIQVGYSLTDRLAIAAGIPYVSARNGDDPSPTMAPIDDGRYRSTFTDFRFDLRWNVLKSPFVLTPFSTVLLPSHDYPTVGEAAPGRGLWEVTVGSYVSRLLDPVIPRTYVQGRYSYTWVEENVGISTDRSNAALEIGHFLSPRVGVLAYGAWQETHGGLNFPADVIGSPELFEAHDRLLDDDNWKIGGGATYSISDALDVYVSGFKTVAGSDSHIGGGVGVGLVWSFGQPAVPGFPPAHRLY